LRWRKERAMSRKRERTSGPVGEDVEVVAVSAVSITFIVRRNLPSGRRDCKRRPLSISPFW
jgi:hypothetical protein